MNQLIDIGATEGASGSSGTSDASGTSTPSGTSNDLTEATDSSAVSGSCYSANEIESEFTSN